MTRWAMICCLVLAPGAAWAQPRLVPGGDVNVTYHLDGAAAEQIPGGAGQGVQLQWDAAGQRLRAEPLGGPVYAIVDLSRRLAAVVFPAQKSILELPLRNGDPQTLLAGADLQFTRRGTGHVLGMECVEWAVHSRKLDGTGCVTPDGVVLRAEGTYDGRPGALQASSVSRARIAGREFAQPDGYFRLPLMGGR